MNVTRCVSQIDTKETDVDAVENGRPARTSSSPTTKSQVSRSADVFQLRQKDLQMSEVSLLAKND